MYKDSLLHPHPAAELTSPSAHGSNLLSIPALCPIGHSLSHSCQNKPDAQYVAIYSELFATRTGEGGFLPAAEMAVSSWEQSPPNPAQPEAGGY